MVCSQNRTRPAAGAYELTPLKRQFRRCCRQDAGSGGVRAVVRRVERRADGGAGGSGDEPPLDGRDHRSWPGAQKLLPPKATIDVASAIARLGTMIVLAPSPVPGLTPPM